MRYVEPPAQAPRELWTVAETAAFLRVPVPTLRHWRYRGEGPRAFKVGRHLRYDPEVVRSWVAEACVSRSA